jgi:ABC-type antimicrobial peptide transport system permease subunit
MSYDVAQRLQELGVRMALGAGRSDVLGMVLAHGARLAGIGVVLGVLASLALTRAIQSLLFGVRATDVQTFAVVALLLAGVGLLATCRRYGPSGSTRCGRCGRNEEVLEWRK